MVQSLFRTPDQLQVPSSPADTVQVPEPTKTPPGTTPWLKQYWNNQPTPDSANQPIAAQQPTTPQGQPLKIAQNSSLLQEQYIGSTGQSLHKLFFGQYQMATDGPSDFMKKDVVSRAVDYGLQITRDKQFGSYRPSRAELEQAVARDFASGIGMISRDTAALFHGIAPKRGTATEDGGFPGPGGQQNPTLKPVPYYPDPPAKPKPGATPDYLKPVDQARATFYANIDRFNQTYADFSGPVGRYYALSKQLSDLKDRGASDAVIKQKTKELTQAGNAVFAYANNKIEPPGGNGARYLETSKANYENALTRAQAAHNIDTRSAFVSIESSYGGVNAKRVEAQEELRRVQANFNQVTGKSINRPQPDQPSQPNPVPPKAPNKPVSDPSLHPTVTKLEIASSELFSNLNRMNQYAIRAYVLISNYGPDVRLRPEFKKAIAEVGNAKEEIRVGLKKLEAIRNALPAGEAYDGYRTNANNLIKNFGLAINGRNNDGMAPWLTGMQAIIAGKTTEVPAIPRNLLGRTQEDVDQVSSLMNQAYANAKAAMDPKILAPRTLDSLAQSAQKLAKEFTYFDGELTKQIGTFNQRFAAFDTGLAQRAKDKLPDDGSLSNQVKTLLSDRGQDPQKTTKTFTLYGKLNAMQGKIKEIDGIIGKMEKLTEQYGLDPSKLQEIKTLRADLNRQLNGGEGVAGSAAGANGVVTSISQRQQALEKLNQDYAAPLSPHPTQPPNINPSGPKILVVPPGSPDLAQLLLTGAATGTVTLIGGGATAGGSALTTISGLGAIPIATNTAIGLGRLLLTREGIKGTSTTLTKLILTQSEITMKGLTVAQLNNPQFVLTAIGAIQIQGVALSTIATQAGVSFVGLVATAWTTEQYRQKASRGEPVDWKGFERDLKGNLDTLQGIEMAAKDPWKKTLPSELERMLNNAGELGKALAEEARKQGMSPQQLAEFLKKHEGKTANEALALLRDGNLAAGGDGGDRGNNSHRGTTLDDGLNWSQRAANLGYTVKVNAPPFNSYGSPVFSNGEYLLTPDVSKHGSIWKMFSLQGKRLGSYDANLNWLRP